MLSNYLFVNKVLRINGYALGSNKCVMLLLLFLERKYAKAQQEYKYEKSITKYCSHKINCIQMNSCESKLNFIIVNIVLKVKLYKQSVQGSLQESKNNLLEYFGCLKF